MRSYGFQRAGGGAADREGVDAFVRAVRDAELAAFPAVGEGEDLRIAAAGVSGGALAARGRVVHLTALADQPA